MMNVYTGTCKKKKLYENQKTNTETQKITKFKYPLWAGTLKTFWVGKHHVTKIDRPGAKRHFYIIGDQLTWQYWKR